MEQGSAGVVFLLGLLCAFFFSSSLAAPSLAQPPSEELEGLCASQLRTYVEKLLEKPEHRRALYGVLVRKVGQPSSTPLYALNAASRFTPASNTKLFSAGSLFLHTDATTFRYTTSVLYRRTTAQLCVRGGGDPSLTYADLAKAAPVVKGVGRVAELMLDKSLFRGDDQPFPTSWEWDDLNWDYGAEPEALIVAENAMTITLSPGSAVGQPLTLRFAIDGDRDAVEVRNAGVTLPAGAEANVTAFYPPGNAFLQIEGGMPLHAQSLSLGLGVINSTARFGGLFRGLLRAQNLSVERVALGECRGSDWVTVYTHQSQPLSVLMDHCLQVSDNLYAEVFARTLGALFHDGPSSGNTLRDGLSLIQTTLAKLGVAADSFSQADGSGLSRHNMLSPESLADVLNGLHTALSPERFDLFKSFLPLAGKSGSLINRFKGTPAEGKVWAKTGSMTGVTSLSGYAANPNFPQQMLIFSIIVNGNTLGQTVAHGVVDSIVENLVQLRDC